MTNNNFNNHKISIESSLLTIRIRWIRGELSISIYFCISTCVHVCECSFYCFVHDPPLQQRAYKHIYIMYSAIFYLWNISKYDIIVYGIIIFRIHCYYFLKMFFNITISQYVLGMSYFNFNNQQFIKSIDLFLILILSIDFLQ